MEEVWDDAFAKEEKEAAVKGKGSYFKTEPVWTNALIFGVSHLAAIPAGYMWLFTISWKTWIFSVVLGLLSSQGILLGAHRYYTHRAYKATLPLRVLVIIWNTIAIQNSLWEWARDHRQHHKYSDTDADPHNANRGFFFSHVGWLMMRKHPEVIAKGKEIDMSDLESDPLVMFQKKYYVPLVAVVAIAMPVFVPMIFWNETLLVSFLIPFMLRLIVVLNFTWSVNSWAHAFGNKPYDRSIRPVESLLVSVISFGEGWHNYHHCFPWDYRASELALGLYSPTTRVINFFAWLGWAYDLKEASPTVVLARARRTGNGSHPHAHKAVDALSTEVEHPPAAGLEDAPEAPSTPKEQPVHDPLLNLDATRAGAPTWSRQ